MSFVLTPHRQRLLIVLLCLALPAGLLFAMTSGKITKRATALTEKNKRETPRPTLKVATTDTSHFPEPAQSGGGYSITHSVIASGGGSSSGGGNQVTGTAGQTATGVSSGGNFSVSGGFWVSGVGCPILSITPSTLTSGRAGVPYPVTTLMVSGGASPYTFTIPVGALPTGMSLSAGGVLDGTPTAFGTFPFTVRATDDNNCIGEQAYSLIIAPPCGNIVVSPASLPNGTVSVAYPVQSFSASGGTSPYTFSVSTGNLPNGLTLIGNTLSGTPTAIGTFNFSIKATDNAGCMGTQAFTVTINNAPVAGLQFYPLAHPVRLLDTRVGATGCDSPGAQIPGNTSRTQTAAGRTCDGLTIPANAKALTGNVTTVLPSVGGFLTLYPSGVTRPLVSNSNYASNSVLNNVFTVGLGAADGAFNIYVASTTDVVVDVTGYYAPPSGSGLYFHPLPHPVRLMDSRVGATACFTPGMLLTAGSTTTQLGTTTCDGVLIPGGALALVGNATTVNPQANGFLTLFPADATRPLAASSNFQTGINMNAPFTVGLSPSGQFNIYTAATTDLVVDVLGYFSMQLNDSNGQGLLFNPLPTPVRLLDTRAAGATGCFTPGGQMIGGTAYLQPATGACTGIPAAAKAVVGNATTVNVAANGFLTFWPSDANQPTVATSNYRSGLVFNRHFTAGLGADGAFKRFASTTTDLVIDLSGYFAP